MPLKPTRFSPALLIQPPRLSPFRPPSFPPSPSPSPTQQSAARKLVVFINASRLPSLTPFNGLRSVLGKSFRLCFHDSLGLCTIQPLLVSSVLPSIITLPPQWLFLSSRKCPASSMGSCNACNLLHTPPFCQVNYGSPPAALTFLLGENLSWVPILHLASTH